MARYLHLQVPSSCREDWNRMIPDHGGRFCLSCQKQVMDFTRMTDAELVQYFKMHKGPACGRFTQNQLDRDIAMPKATVPWAKYLFSFALPAFLLSLKSSGQAAKSISPTVIAPAKPLSDTSSLPHEKLFIKGSVTDEQGVPIPGASVIVKGTSRGVVTDTAGKFEINDVDPAANLAISFVGYEWREVALSSVATDKPIMLTLSERLLGEVIVAGYYVPENRKHGNESKEVVVKDSPGIFAFPNPVNPGSTLNIRCNKIKPVNYVAQIYTLGGTMVKSMRATIANRNGQMSINVGQLPYGTYILEFVHEKSDRVYSQQIVVGNGQWAMGNGQ